MSITRRATRFRLCILALFFFLPAALVMATQSSTAVGAANRETKSSIPGQAQAAAYAPVCDPNWTIVPSANTGSNNILHGITAIASNDVWAVGQYTSPSGPTAYPTLAEHWDGTAWSVVSTPNVGTYHNAFQAVDAVSSNDVWAVGWYALSGDTPIRTLIEHWNGSTWTIVPSPSEAEYHSHLYGVSAIASNDVWAVGWYDTGNGDGVLIEHWDGSAWSMVSEPASDSTSSSVLYSVSALSSNDVWAVGAIYDEVSTHTQALIEHWDGSAWSVVPGPSATIPILYGVDARASNDVWAVGAYHDASGFSYETLIEHWNGTSWTVVPSSDSHPDDPDFNSSLSGVVAIASNDVWAVGEDGSGALIEHWDGTTWSVVPAPFNATADLVQVDAIASNDVWAAGDSAYGTLIERYNPCTGGPTPVPSPTPCSGFSDVPSGSTFYSHVTCLVDRSIISGYSDCTFRPQNLITRGQIAKIVSNAAGYTDDVSSRRALYSALPRLDRAPVDARSHGRVQLRRCW
jgi:hypothetical protein